MKRVEKDGDVYYFFGSMEDFTQYMVKMEDYHPFLNKNECISIREKRDNGFHSIKTWKKFITALKGGMRGAEKDKNIFHTDTYMHKFNIEKHVNGQPVIPRVLKNIPKAYNRLKKNKKTGFYNIFINIGEYWGIKDNKVKEYRNYIYNKIYTLIKEANTVELNIYAKIISTKTDNSMSMVIKLKPAMYEVNIDRLMFFVTNSDILRRGMFRLMEVDPLMYKDCRFAYGRPAKSRDQDIEKQLRGILVHNLTSFDGLDEDGHRVDEFKEAVKDVEERLLETQTN